LKHWAFTIALLLWAAASAWAQAPGAAPQAVQTDIPSIYKTLAGYFPVGAAIDPADLSGPHEQMLTMHFDGITSTNEMKWSSIEPAQGRFEFGPADRGVELALSHKMRVRGHTLVYATGQQTPSYAFGDGTNSAANQAIVIANIREHIQSEVQHFGDKVYAWDVVNEPFDPSQADCLAHGPFYQVLGKSYIDVAFQAAREYAPAGTKLFINDYSTNEPNRLGCLLKVVGDLRARGIPIDGVGHQMHNAINYPSVPAMENAIETVRSQFPGLDQQITELDVSVYNGGDTKSNYGRSIPASVLAEQGWLYKSTFDLFRRLKGKISAVTLWGIADDDTWLDRFPVVRTEYPLPFDRQLQAKPAYWGIVDETRLPGYGLKFSAAAAKTQSDTRTITVTATNGDAGPAYASQIKSIGLRPVSAEPRCAAAVSAPASFPVSLGDIPTSGTAAVSIAVTLRGCDPHTRFAFTAAWSSATYETGTFSTTLDIDGDSGEPRR